MDDSLRNEYVKLMKLAVEENNTQLKRKKLAAAYKFLSDNLPSSLYKFYSLGTNMDDKKLNTLERDKIWVDLLKIKMTLLSWRV